MASVRTKNGSALLKNGSVSCVCCDIELGLAFGEIGVCDCDTVVCFDSQTNPSPPSLTIGSGTFFNETPGTGVFQLPIVYHQAATIVDDSIVGWVNLVSGPSVVQLTGSVGGDVKIWQLTGPGSAGEWNGYQLPQDILDNFESEYRINGSIPDEGEWPCGTCDQLRNGPHVINAVFVLLPNTYFGIQPITYFNCFPNYRLTLRVVSAFTPP